MNTTDSGRDEVRPELDIDFTCLLGSGQVFAGANDPQLQAELIDANCNKIGVEGGCCAIA